MRDRNQLHLDQVHTPQSSSVALKKLSASSTKVLRALTCAEFLKESDFSVDIECCYYGDNNSAHEVSIFARIGASGVVPVIERHGRVPVVSLKPRSCATQCGCVSCTRHTAIRAGLKRRSCCYNVAVIAAIAFYSIFHASGRESVLLTLGNTSRNGVVRISQLIR
jgi:hypothetical protein